MMRFIKYRVFKDFVQKVKDSLVGFKLIDFFILGFIDVDFLLYVVLYYLLKLIFQEFQLWLDSVIFELDVVLVWNEDKLFSKEIRFKKFCILLVFCIFLIKFCLKDDINRSYIVVLICLQVLFVRLCMDC